MDRGEPGSIDPRLVRAIAHPIRLTILELLQARTASARELAAELDESVSRISYHVEVLVECDCLELVHSRPRRGFNEHFYIARPRAFIGARQWRRIAPSVRGGLTGPVLEVFFDRAVGAYEAGKLDEREQTTLGCTSVVLDRIGVVAANDLLDDFLRGIEAIHEQSIERIKDSGRLGIPAIVACAVFEPADAAPVALAPPAE